MRRSILASVLALVLTQAASANPLSRTWHWAGHHKRILAVLAFNGTAAGVHAYGLHHCRRVNGVEPCDEHYGSAWSMFGFTVGLNMIAAPALAESYWKDGGGKFGYAIASGGSAIQLAWGIHEARINRPREHEVKPSAPMPSLLTLRF